VNPPAGAANVPASVPFEWTPVHAVECYSLWVGTTLGADDLLSTGETAATSYRADGLPRGVTLYVRLWTKVGGVWRSADSQFSIIAQTIVRVAGGSFVFDGAAHAAMATATDTSGFDVAGSVSLSYTPGGLTLPVAAGTYIVTATFTSADPRFEDARAIGSIVIQPGSPRLTVKADSVTFDGAVHEASAVAVGLDGAPVAGTFTVVYSPGGAAPSSAGVYAVSARFASADPNYADAEGGATLTVNQAVPRLVLQDRIFSNDNQPHGTTAGVTGLDGRTVAGTVALAYAPGGAAQPVSSGVYVVTATFTSADPNYTNANATSSLSIQSVPLVASLTYPLDGAADVDLSVPLQWTAVDRPDLYYVYVGSSRGASDLVASGELSTTSYRVSNLYRGETVFVRLWTKVQGIWRYRDTTFTARSLVPKLTYPRPNAVDADVSQPLQWTAVTGADTYYLYVGSTPGAKDLVDSGAIVATSYLASRVPSGRVLYIRLWTRVGGVWRYGDTTFIATPSS
jgi:hypothetical protein